MKKWIFLFFMTALTTSVLAASVFDSVIIEDTLELNGTDVETAIDSKEPELPSGDIGEYLRGDKTFHLLDTSVVPENGNLYFTNARARSALSATAPLSYNSSTGNFTTSMATGKLLGRSTASTGVAEEISIGTGLLLSGGTLSATGSGTVSDVTASAPLASSGGSTPDISITQADTDTDGYLSSTDWNTFNNKVSTSRSISTTSPLSGGGDLSTNRTFSIADAAADGSTKGAASFTANDFNASSGNISLDYTNGQAASGSAKGFLTSSDWTTFNSKQAGPLTGDVTTSGAAATIANNAVTNAKAADMAAATIKGRFPGAGTGDPTDLTTTQMAEMFGLMGLTAYTSPAENDYLLANENASGLNKRLALGTLADYASNAFITVYSSGSGTHNFNPNVATFKAVLIGGGGGGGSGRTAAAGNSRFGGGGGGGGAYVVFEGRPTLTSIDYSVGAGGDGGAANAGSGTNGNPGTAGGNTTISDSNGLLVTAQGGNFGAGGGLGGGGAGGAAIAASCYSHPAVAAYSSSAGGIGGTTANTAGGAMAVAGPTGGGGGGGINTSNVRGAGQEGGSQGPSVGVWQNPGGAGGAAETAVIPAEDGFDGSNTGSYFGVGGGGGGGASGTSGTLFSGRGGDGALFGGGGGGGGAALNGVEASRGGNGGSGVVIIYEYLDR